MSHNYRTPLIRTDTSSSVSTNATAPNQPGPGRLVGRLFDRLGKRIESLLNKRASNLGTGPVPVAQEIRSLRRHRELTLLERYSMPPRKLSEGEAKTLKKLCNKLVKYVRSEVLSTQISALEEVTALAMDDLVIRAVFAECRLEYFEPKYTEPNLLLSTTKALCSIKDTATHELWSTIILRPKLELDWQTIGRSFRDPDSSFIAARHLSNLLQLAIADGI
ncbi:hypothetical protein SCHPADRAFT_656886 [Schizopora paradoxa]|uniref:Uncharacterized protein n=1 Tax=Schizopora paradoxa TaxID=27342 RepID=A0A0H2RQZ5_9AGAM|nr:hypothetical protein SCHPADRAFT_656886 [Schizopora paradoxa]